MQLKVVALALMLIGTSGFAQAQSNYNASFQLDGPPALRTGSPFLDQGRATVGQWNSELNQADSNVNTREFLGTDVNGAAQWSSWTGAGEMHASSGIPLGMSSGRAYMAPGWTETYGSAATSSYRLGASIAMTEPYGQGQASGTWTRGFSIDPNSSLTFSGVGQLSITGENIAPLSSSFSHVSNASFGAVIMADAADRVRTTIGASLNTSGGGLFSYSTSENGSMSLTITNTLSTSLAGTFYAGSYINALVLPEGLGNVLTAPVPEPATYLTMILGLGIVGGVARKKKQAVSSSAAMA